MLQRVWWMAVLAVMVLGAAMHAGAQIPKAPAGGAGDPGEDFQAPYQAVVAAMKSPVATGVLVTEIGPLSAAGRAGLRAGDIITSYGGRETRTLPALKAEVAEALGSRAVEDDQHKLLMVVRRGGGAGAADTILQMPRAPLSVLAIEVEAGVPAALNPPPSPRGTLTMAWDKLPAPPTASDTEAENGEEISWYRLYDDGAWVGFQKVVRTQRGIKLMQMDVVTTRIELMDEGAKVTARTNETCVFRTGDQGETPAFVLESLSFADDSRLAAMSSHAQRSGGKLAGGIRADPEHGEMARSVSVPLSAMTPGALPLVGAALAQNKDGVLGCTLVSGWDLLPRPGYVLAARGQQKVEGATRGEESWRVDLMHCGVVVESYWYSAQRRLLRTQGLVGVKHETLRVGSEAEAKAAVTTMPATRKAE